MKKAALFFICMSALSCAHQNAQQTMTRDPNNVTALAKMKNSEFSGSFEDYIKNDMPLAEHTTQPLQHVQLADQRTKSLLAVEKTALLKHVGLASETAKWDYLQKDMLLIRATYQNAAELSEKYPVLPADNLSKLQEVIKQFNLADRT